jgi:hypothetical protein
VVAAVQYLLSRGEHVPLDAAALAPMVITSSPMLTSATASFVAEGPKGHGAADLAAAVGFAGGLCGNDGAPGGSRMAGAQGVTPVTAAAAALQGRQSGIAAMGAAHHQYGLQAALLRIRPSFLEVEPGCSRSSSSSDGEKSAGLQPGIEGAGNACGKRSFKGISSAQSSARALLGAVGSFGEGEGVDGVAGPGTAAQEAVVRVSLMAVTGRAVLGEVSVQLLERVVSQGLEQTMLEGTSEGIDMKRKLVGFFAKGFALSSEGQGQARRRKCPDSCLELQQGIQQLLEEAQQLEEAVAAKRQRAASAAVKPSAKSLPPLFVCPLTYDVMEDPVVAADGFTYERAAISRWLQVAQRSPMTNKPMQRFLVPNHALRSSIQEWTAHVPI